MRPIWGPKSLTRGRSDLHKVTNNCSFGDARGLVITISIGGSVRLQAWIAYLTGSSNSTLKWYPLLYQKCSKRMENEAVPVAKFHIYLAVALKIKIKLEWKLPDILLLGKCQTALRFAGDLLTGRQRKTHSTVHTKWYVSSTLKAKRAIKLLDNANFLACHVSRWSLNKCEIL